MGLPPFVMSPVSRNPGALSRTCGRTCDGEEVHVHHDVHTLGIFSRATWLRLLEEVGFRPLRVVGAQGLDIFLGIRAVG